MSGVIAHAQTAPEVRAVPGEYIVKLKSGAVSQVQGKLRGKATLKAAFHGTQSFHFKSSDASLVNALKGDPEVEYVEPNFILNAVLPEISQQNLTAQAIQYYDQTGASVRATEAWAHSSAYSSGNRPIVAIVDTGMAKSHTVFTDSGALWNNPGEIPGNGIDDDMNGYVDDVNGWNFINNSPNFNDDQNHGTHVAGIVLGATQDILAVNMEPAKIRLMPLKFLDANGSGTTAAAINAIYYAVNMGAKVINCSWGGAAYSHALHDALAYAYNHGVLVVTAAGNYSSNNDIAPLYPANYDVPSNIAVAATTDSDRLASFSNYGVNAVPVGAPGVYVFSTMPGGYFASLSGTSMAAPFVAGAAALAFREAPQISGFQLRDIILSSVDYSGHLHGKVTTGGRINAESLILNAKAQISAQSYQPTYMPSYKADRLPASEDAMGGGAGCGMIRALSSGAGPGSPGASGMIAVLLSLPFLVWFALRKRHSVRDYRRYERFVMESEVVIRAGERRLVGQMKTIALGGLSFKVDEALEKGSSVMLKIAGPDGADIEVEGRIVWSEQNQAYGVQFGEMRESMRDTLFSWTRVLAKSKM